MPPSIGVVCRQLCSYGHQVVLAAAAELRQAGFHPLITPLLGAGLVEHATGYLGFFQAADQDSLRALDRPTVNLNSASGPGIFPCVVPDDKVAGRLAAEHLLERGFKRIVFVARDERPATRQRREAVCQSVQCANAHFAAVTLRLGDWPEWLDQLPRPVGLIGSDDTVAAEVLGMTEARGWCIPEEIAILGIGNDEMAQASARLGLSSVDLNPALVGQRAAATLVGILRGQKAPILVRIAPRGVIVRASSDAFATSDKLMAEILQFARTHLHEGISVDRLAQTFGMSRRHLSRMFLERLSLSPSTMLQRLAVAHAKHLLANSELSIAQVAARCGYDNLSHFGVLFRDFIGTSPAAFRQQHRRAG